MNTKKLIISLSCFIIAAFLSHTSSAFAEGIKDRMINRLPIIKELKSSGVLGENNIGYLEFRQAPGSSQDVVNEENSDRTTVYTAIAEKQGATVDFVGKRRAVQISENAEPGTWLQNNDGQWYKK